MSEKVPHRRSVRNFLLNPRMQARISLYFVVFGFAVTTFMMFIFFTHIHQIEAVINSISGIPLEHQTELGYLLSGLVKIMLLFFFIFIVASTLYGLLVSHRIAGPMYVILSYIEEIKNGNYESNRKLRDNDELVPIMDSLRELAQNLKNKK